MCNKYRQLQMDHISPPLFIAYCLSFCYYANSASFFFLSASSCYLALSLATLSYISCIILIFSCSFLSLIYPSKSHSFSVSSATIVNLLKNYPFLYYSSGCLCKRYKSMQSDYTYLKGV